MKRLIVPVLALIALLGIFLIAEWLREHPSLHSADLRVFNPEKLARMETEMWRSYYERRPGRLFRQMVIMLENQYGMPPLWAVRNGYRAANAAFVFKDGHNRADYEKALPDLRRYYQDIAALADRPFDANRAARLELEWWIVHREDPAKLPAALSELQAEVYGQPATIFETHARFRAEAMKRRDLKGQAISDADWDGIGELLRQSWVALHDALPPRK